MDTQVYRRENFQFWIEDGVAHGYYMDGCVLTLTFAKEILRMRLEMQQGIEYPMIVLIDDSVVINPDARKYLALEGYEGISKVALVTKSKVKAIVSNIFMMIDKRPQKPTRLFSDKTEALKWVRQL